MLDFELVKHIVIRLLTKEKSKFIYSVNKIKYFYTKRRYKIYKDMLCKRLNNFILNFLEFLVILFHEMPFGKIMFPKIFKIILLH